VKIEFDDDHRARPRNCNRVVGGTGIDVDDAIGRASNRVQAALQSIAFVTTNDDRAKSRHGARRRTIFIQALEAKSARDL